MKKRSFILALLILNLSKHLTAANIPVMTNADTGTGSLRDAINTANTNSDMTNIISLSAITGQRWRWF